METRNLVITGAILLLAGCASYDGRGLVPGKATAGDVEALMGPPAESLKVAGGDSIWYYPRAPQGTQTYAVRVSPDGVMRSIEQVLDMANLKKLVAGATTSGEVRELLGPPMRVNRFERQERDVWQYRMIGYSSEPHFLYVQFSNDGLVREVILLKDMYRDQGDGRSR